MAAQQFWQAHKGKILVGGSVSVLLGAGALWFRRSAKQHEDDESKLEARVRFCVLP